MAKKISQLTQATEVKSDDVTVIVQDGETKKLPLNMMVTKQDVENKKIAGLAKLDEIEATYENDSYTPTITVKNKSSVKTGEGDEVDYSANVMDGHVKSAILTGQTLVNLCKDSWWNGSLTNGYDITQPLKPNNKYIIFVNSINNIAEINLAKSDFIPIVYSTNNNDNYFIFTTPDSTSELTKVRIVLSEAPSSEPHYEAILLEYQEGIENWNIPYFEGMQSVKLPVLTTTGKNLFDMIDFANTLNQISPNVEIIDNNTLQITTTNLYRDIKYRPIKFKQNTQYVFQLYGETIEGRDRLANHISIYYTDGTKATCNKLGLNVLVTDKEKTVDYIGVSYGVQGVTETISNISLVEGISTEIEPFKSNILSTSEDVELRGIGDVQDTLNCLTGEVVERIGEIVLDGTQDMLSDGNGVYIQVNDVKRFLDYTGKIACDKLPVMPTYGHLAGVENGISGYTNSNGHLGKNWLYVKINNSINKDEVKEWLTQNPITVQYQRVAESIKTVDLMPSGTHPSTTPYCWKNGHIQLSSSGLLPNLEYSVVTSRAGQINQNATMIVKNDKRIFDLEILLAGGLVNTTYQALTLQNQVETGLSKVSLNSETEPDYLLYHMIMKLIEEKAYKLDDLTEKVSVFYLYEKLSDEQFETIYSALYPFVEDEIVEEPVVEELPEVVEDEVIM